MKPESLVSVIILNWNGEAFLEKCLASVVRTSYQPVEIIVVDNASTDRSLEIIRGFDVKLVQNSSNLGYAAGNNAGFAVATGKYLATLNNDLTVEPDWLDEPVQFLENHSDVGIVSSRQMNFFDPSKVDALFTYPTNSLVFNRMANGLPFRPEERLHSKPGYVVGAVGAAALWRKEVIDSNGGFDSRFFAFHEESDLCMRAFLQGWKCLYSPSSVVYHMGNQSFKRRKRVFYYYRERNRWWFYYKFFPVGFILLRLPFIFARELKTLLAVAVWQRYPGVYLRSKIDGIKGMAALRQERLGFLPKFKEKSDLYKRLIREKIIFL